MYVSFHGVKRRIIIRVFVGICRKKGGWGFYFEGRDRSEAAPARRIPVVQTKAEGQYPKMALALMRDLFGLDTSKLLKEAKVQVRCINSAGGYKFFTPTAVETNKKYADFGAVTIDDVGHHPMLEKPDEFDANSGTCSRSCDQEVTRLARHGRGAKKHCCPWPTTPSRCLG